MFAKMEYGVYFFFASLMILSSIFVWFLVPESKGIPLESMDELFKTKPVWRAHGTVISKLREEEERFRHDIEDAGLTEGKGDFVGQQVEDSDQVVKNA